MTYSSLDSWHEPLIAKRSRYVQNLIDLATTPDEETGFSNASVATMAVANSTGGASAGSGATLVLTLGGRAGRKSYQTLVAAKSIVSTHSQQF